MTEQLIRLEWSVKWRRQKCPNKKKYYRQSCRYCSFLGRQSVLSLSATGNTLHYWRLLNWSVVRIKYSQMGLQQGTEDQTCHFLLHFYHFQTGTELELGRNGMRNCPEFLRVMQSNCLLVGTYFKTLVQDLFKLY